MKFHAVISLLVFSFAQAGLAASASLYPLTVLSDNPSAYWRLDESAGSIAHDLIAGHDCLFTNAALGAAGYSSADPNSAMVFGTLARSNSFAGEVDKSAQGIAHLDFSQPAGTNGEFSVEAWVKGNPQTQDAGIVTKGFGNGGEQFTLDTGSDTVTNHGFRFSIRDAGGLLHIAASSLAPNSHWHHLVGICDEPQGRVRLYIDGVESTNVAVPAGVGLLAKTNGAVSGSALVSIGARTSSATATSFDLQFVGTIDEVALYGYALSAGQVQAHYQAGVSALRLASPELRGTNVILKGSGGVSNAPYLLLSSANIGLPLTNWTALATNFCSGTGHFNLTNPLPGSVREQFYRAQVGLPSEAFWIPPCGAWLGAEVTNSESVAYSNHEANIGRQLDILRGYHSLSNWTSLNAREMTYFNAGRKLFLSFKPDPYWSNAVGVANGGSMVVDAELASLARSLAALNPRKLMLCVWHEPQNDLATNGTPIEYVMMWHNVRAIFDANGATNIIWTWVVEGSAQARAPVPSLWPGNAYVDWVGWDMYQASAGADFVAKQIEMYDWMVNNSTTNNDYVSKPWAWPEWGVGINGWFPTVFDQTNTINAVNAALNSRLFPRVRYAAYFDTDGTNGGSSAILPGAWGSYSNLANSPYVTQEYGPRN